MILLTGSTGILGAQLLLKLNAQGKRIRAVYRTEEKFKNHPLLNKNELEFVDWLQEDLNAVNFDELLVGITEVYHCAAMVSFDHKDEQKLFENNRDITAALVDACLKIPTIKLVHTSSVAALNTEDPLNIREGEAWDEPRSPTTYGLSKFKAELEVWRGIEFGLKAVIVNPTVIVGPGPWAQSTANLFQMVAKGLKFYSPGGTGFVGAEDCAELMIQLMESDIEAERFLLNAQNMSFKEFFGLVASSLNKKAPSICPPRWAAEIAWRGSTLLRKMGINSFLTKESTRSAYGLKKYSAEKVVNRLNYSFQPIEKCIQQTGATYLERSR